MNVVGKVGSLITQGVYSVATPFHPFGGAIDVIVVQQQDGTFRSTPWYVRFGKFQGVLKGAEKIVRINVNGVEANFHMYLDNSGEAYFVKEVDDDNRLLSKGVVEDSNNSQFTREDGDMKIDNKDNGNLIIGDNHVHRLDHSVSDTGMLQLKDQGDSLDVPRIQRAESDGDRRYYEFQEDPSSFEDSIELSEYGSARYDNLDGEIFADSQEPHSEVVLVSVDGHILTAPLSESEQNAENVELRNPQFHLGPGEGAELCEGKEEFISGENACDAAYISKVDVPTTGVAPNSYCNTNCDDNVSGLQQDGCLGEEEHTIQVTEDLKQTDSGEVATDIKRENVFQSCLELQEFAQLDRGSSLEARHSASESNANSLVAVENEQGSIVQYNNVDHLPSPSGSASPGDNRPPNSELGHQEVEVKASGVVDSVSSSPSISNDAERNDVHIGKSVSVEGVDDSQQIAAAEDNDNGSELVKPQIATSDEGDESHSGLEISLCGHELKAGMGLAAAAEAFEVHRISAEEFRSSAPSLIKNENLIIKFKGRYLSWEKAASLVLGMAAFGFEVPLEPKGIIPVEQDDALKSRDDDPGSTSSGRRWRLWPIPFRKVKTIEHTNSNLSTDEIFVDSESGFQNSFVEPSPTSSNLGSPHKKLIRTNVPTNEQIASLNLKDGQNFVTFSFSTRVLGTQQVDAHIFLWKWNARIVISDVDGTITKSDVLGQFMPLVGKDWTQSGVAKLFSAIKENGYQLLFLSARAIVQAYLTRSFLLNLKQDGKALPDGPVVISPDGLFPSLFREVIRRAPHEFKIACLEDIKRLFPADYNPFYAGFGNRDTDELSYRKIGIPKGKIFIINPKGEVAISHRIDVKSYTSLHTLVNDMFPPTCMVEQEDFNSWNFWRMPLPDIE
ncbi:hypothetical protein L6164_009859 [Bauhinia variegata]|uniref:Uncharacterized protein n=1 Tax=Bauhinia variegata TaxID=167791 RepID=A0ACB9PP06_BAUVA|nr:hypothetical protein L6164_009859 [Bauhinia variegata]